MSSLYAHPMPRPGADLALLLLGGYRAMVDAVVAELAERGHPDFRPVHELTLRAVAAGAQDTSAVARRLEVSKQAAAKTVAVLVERGYLSRTAHPSDARRKHLAVTARGDAAVRQGEAAFARLRAAWAEQVGDDRLTAVETTLRALLGDDPVPAAHPGWAAHAVD